MKNLIFWLWGILVLMSLPACTPSLNWREVRAAEADARAMFPCKPDVFSRAAETPGALAAELRAGLLVCSVGGQSFSLSWSDLGDPAEVTAALRLMRERLSLKLGAPAAQLQPFGLPGSTPNESAGCFTVLGRSSDGITQVADALVFARGRRVYQLLMLGQQPSPAVWDSFARGVRLL